MSPRYAQSIMPPKISPKKIKTKSKKFQSSSLCRSIYNPFPTFYFLPSNLHLGILPSCLSRIRQSKGIKAQTLANILPALDISIDLIRPRLRLPSITSHEPIRATSRKSKMSIRLLARWRGMYEASGISAHRNGRAVGLREAQGTVLSNIDLLPARYGIVEASAGSDVQGAGLEDGSGVLEAGAVDDAAGAVGGGCFADPEGLAGGVDLAVVDGGGGADGH